jgi:hypothetical protein
VSRHRLSGEEKIRTVFARNRSAVAVGGTGAADTHAADHTELLCCRAAAPRGVPVRSEACLVSATMIMVMNSLPARASESGLVGA